jgi:excisionase family DNA binding protein
MTLEKTYNASQVAELAGVHANTVFIWIKKGQLDAHKVGKAWRVKESVLKAFLGA